MTRRSIPEIRTPAFGGRFYGGDRQSRDAILAGNANDWIGERSWPIAELAKSRRAAGEGNKRNAVGNPAGNRIGEEVDGGGLVPARHDELNQLAESGAGPVRFAGTLDEPGQVRVGGQEARMRSMTDFEAWLELVPGTHQIDITAEDDSDNSTTETFEVHIADEGTVALTYDLNGNLLSRVSDTTTTTYERDAANRLIAIEVEEGTRSEFTYDGLSRRVGIIEKTWDTNTSSFILHPSEFILLPLGRHGHRRGTLRHQRRIRRKTLLPPGRGSGDWIRSRHLHLSHRPPRQHPRSRRRSRQPDGPV